MANRRRTPTTSGSPLAKAGKMLGGILSARAGGAAGQRGGRRQPQQGGGLSRLLRGGRR